MDFHVRFSRGGLNIRFDNPAFCAILVMDSQFGQIVNFRNGHSLTSRGGLLQIVCRRC